MVTIINCHQRTGKDEKQFTVLELQGDVELVESHSTGRFYATARRATVTSTFDEVTSKALIGTKLPGTIIRDATEPYQFTIPETGEVIQLGFKYRYQPEAKEASNSSITKKEFMLRNLI